MVNMQMSAEEAKEYTDPQPSDAPKYPWGLCLCLDDDSLAKLGITTPPQVGSVVQITAKAVVTGTRADQRMGGDKEIGLDVQITDMDMSPAAADSNPAQSLYG